MQEKQVTIGDESMILEKPFIVLATQNPVAFKKELIHYQKLKQIDLC